MAENSPFLNSYAHESAWDAEKEENVCQDRLKRHSRFFARNWKDIALAISTITTLLLVLAIFCKSVLSVEGKPSHKTSLRKHSNRVFTKPANFNQSKS